MARFNNDCHARNTTDATARGDLENTKCDAENEGGYIEGFGNSAAHQEKPSETKELKKNKCR